MCNDWNDPAMYGVHSRCRKPDKTTETIGGAGVLLVFGGVTTLLTTAAVWISHYSAPAAVGIGLIGIGLLLFVIAGIREDQR